MYHIIIDCVTTYHPLGEPIPAYRYTANIVKLMNFIYLLDSRFAQSYWSGVPLVPSGQAVTADSQAKSPKDAIAEAQFVVTSLAAKALLVDPEITISATTAKISDQNPDRIEMVVPITLSGNTYQKSVELKFAYKTGA